MHILRRCQNLVALTRSKLLILLQVLALLLIKSVDSTTETDLRGLHFNIIAFQSPPFDAVIRGPNGTLNVSGANVVVHNWLAQRLKFTIAYLPLNNTLIDKLGTHEGAFYTLMNDKNVDGLLVAFYLTMDRVERFDYTSSSWSEGFSFVAPRPGEESRLFAFIGPFQPMVWMSVFISVFFVIATMTVFTWLYSRRRRPVNTVDTTGNTELKNVLSVQRSILPFIGSHMIYVINTMTNQGGREFSSHTSFRVLAGAWVLCAMVLVNSYTGIVTSSLTTPKLKPPMNTLEELAASNEVKIVIRSDTSTGVQILQATSGIFKVLGDQVRSEPDRIFTDPFKLAAKLGTGHFAFPFNFGDVGDRHSSFCGE
ncbi:hypothetical protein DAPPUDRAFT_98390 [Daphnia pulex]|uniref:Ionotropic glutamate receptor C-terminal domain-containing protein n=1 Tax=Daphnia pulex TaxID=6669 RepID=E9G3I6_DAPPU|nr:hypothetical protein DAPPUDRAFT_98390 [Daphnia pulex]|eukprot:EFX85981.1 hypothetical protein DAPPUDRAFT_98390 [Daphnia pulex]